MKTWFGSDLVFVSSHPDISARPVYLTREAQLQLPLPEEGPKFHRDRGDGSPSTNNKLRMLRILRILRMLRMLRTLRMLRMQIPSGGKVKAGGRRKKKRTC